MAISMGECAGTGPEVIVKALAAGAFPDVVVFGARCVFERLSSDLALSLPFSAYVSSLPELGEAIGMGKSCIFYDIRELEGLSFEYGHVSAQTGRASFLSLRKAVEAITNGYAYSLVTGALSSEALSLAGYSERSNSDLLRTFADTDRLISMLYSGPMDIFLLSDRCSVSSAAAAVTRESIINALILIDSLHVSSFFDRSKPIAVAALNPPDEDGGWTGNEEENAIIPAIETARKIGISVSGPYSAENLYTLAKHGSFSSILAYLRNEAYAAASSYGIDNTVVISWGLPFACVMLSQETELDIAGMKQASGLNMSKALETAIMLSGPDQMA